jgi:hypothetical protein
MTVFAGRFRVEGALDPAADGIGEEFPAFGAEADFSESLVGKAAVFQRFLFPGVETAAIEFGEQGQYPEVLSLP